MPVQLTEEIFRALLESLPTGVYLVDRERRILFWNDGAERITGYHRQEVIGRFCHNDILMHCDQEERLLCGAGCPLLQTVQDGQPREADVFLRHKDGQRVPVRVRAVPVRDADDVIIGAAESFDELATGTQSSLPGRSDNLVSIASDPTGLPGRIATVAELRGRISEFVAGRTPFVVMCIAIDGLAHFRQMYGTKAIQSVLHTTAQTIRRNLGVDEYLGRWSEELFVAVLTGGSVEEVEPRVEQLRRLVSLGGAQWWGELLTVTIATGLAVIELGDTADDVVQRAEAALRLAFDLETDGAQEPDAPAEQAE
jgi:PAS domain S-box-containing protein/diguanylate cyclase (GGDEF)-like protein